MHKNYLSRAMGSGVICLAGLAITHSVIAEETPDGQTSQITIERISVHGQAAPMLDTIDRALNPSIAPDVRNQLATEPGVSINSNGVVTGIIQHRGMFGDRVHVAHDGATIYGAGPNAMDSPLSHVISAENPTVRLYRGVSPVSSGYETIGGAVVFNPQQWDFSTDGSMQYSGMASLGYTDNGERQQYALTGEAISDNWGVRASGQYQTGDDYDDGSGERVFNTQYNRRMAGLSGIWQNGDHELTYRIGHNHTNVAGTPALAMDIEFIDAVWYRLGYAHQLDQAELKVQFFGNNNRHDMSNFVLRDRMPAMQRRNDVSSDVLGLKLSYESQWQNDNGSFTWDSGAQVIQRDQDSYITNPANSMFFINNFVDVERNVITAYGEINWQGKQGLFATAGLRPTQISLDAGEVGSNMAMMNPNVAALVMQFNQSDRSQDRDWVDASLQFGSQVNQNFRVYANLAQKGRAPSYHELYTWFPLGISAGLADGRNYIGDVNLVDEQATQFELALDYQKGGFSVQPRLFWYDIKDYITGRPAQSQPANMIAMMMGAMPPLQWSNVDAEIYGGDIALSYRISDAWQLQVSAEWLTGTDTDLDQPLYRLAPRSLDIHASYQAKQWRAYAQWNLVEAQEDVSTIQNESATSGYGVLNLGGDYAVNDALTFNLAIHNALDKDYVNHLGGINRVAGANVAVGERVPELGRAVTLALTWQF